MGKMNNYEYLLNQENVLQFYLLIGINNVIWEKWSCKYKVKNVILGCDDKSTYLYVYHSLYIYL